MAKLNRSQFKFRRHETIGTEGAEEDQEFLPDCFVDTGDLQALRDTENPKRIVVGRTGAGKTALLIILQAYEEHVAWIDPHQLSLHYVANSTLLRHLEQLGVKLDVFYRLLWKHILAVELIQLKYRLRSEDDQKNFIQRMTELFLGDKRKKDALDYLVEWGEHFWQDTEYRIHEVTDKFQEDVKASLGAKAALLDVDMGGSATHSVEDKREIVHRAQEVVNAVQIQRLARVLDILAEDVFGVSQPRFYIIIDRLDEDWADDPLRYRLIRALIETIRDLQVVRSGKVIVALRKDLLDRVFRETRDSGFQEEKYQPLILRLQWMQDQLLEVLDARLNKLVSRQYTKVPVTWRDLFPRKIGTEDTGQYLVRRTLYRPRDMIQFANCCIEAAVGRPDVTQSLVRQAEGRYSALRFRSLGDEWASDYPELLKAAAILRRRPPAFHLTEISEQDIERVCLDTLDTAKGRQGKISRWVEDLLNDRVNLPDFRLRLIKVFYRVGLVGIRPSVGTATSWSFLDRDVLHEADIGEDARLEVSPTFYRVLGIQTRPV